MAARRGDEVALLDCVDGIGACQTGKELEWVGKLVGCTPKIQGISKSCNGGGMAMP
jgi:hypothetical protein